MTTPGFGRLVLAAAVWMLAAGGFPSHAAAQSLDRLFVGQRIASARVVVTSGGEDVRDLARLVETQPGQPLSIEEVRETIIHLMSIGRFENVEVDATPVADGVALVYACVPMRRIGRLAFRGNLGLPQADLRTAVVERHTSSPPPGRADDAARTLLALLDGHGFTNAAVTSRLEDGPRPDRPTLVFDVEAGSRARVSRLAIEGEYGMTRGTLLEHLGLAVGAPFDLAAAEARATRLVESLQASGFYEARVNLEPAFSADRTTVDLTIAGGRGPLVAVAIRGADIPKKRQAELVPVKQEGSLDEDLLEDASRNIEDYLRAQGYRDARAERVPEKAGDRLTIVFEVERGPRFRVASVQVPAELSIPLPPLQVRQGDIFVQSKLDADLGAIREQYRQSGFRRASVKAEAVRAGDAPAAAGGLRAAPPAGDVQLAVRIDIDEGPRTLVRAVVLDGNQALREATLTAGFETRVGDAYEQASVASDADRILLHYLNEGYQLATVVPRETFSEDQARVDIAFTIVEGPRVVVDRVLVVGNRRTSVETIEREMGLTRGQPLGSDDLAEGQLRLSALGLFRRVRVTQLPHGDTTYRDVLVVVEEAPSTTIGYGAGVEGGPRLRGEVDGNGEAVESYEVAPRGSFEVGRRNLWGKNRSLNLFTRVSIRSKDVGQEESASSRSGGGLGFREYRVLGTYREPRFVASEAEALLSVYAEQAVRSSFNFNRRGTSASVVYHFSPQVTVSGRYGVERTRLFNQRINENDRLQVDRLFPQLRLSIFSASVVRDTRSDPADPSDGWLFSVDGEIAPRSLGSEVGMAKTFVQGFFYRRLGQTRVVFAGGGRLGLATGFARGVPGGGEVVDEVPASERFFAGGDTTVRGFALDRLGARDTLDRNGVSKGGAGLLIFNAELRVPLRGKVSAVSFLDLGNVFAEAQNIDLMSLRGGAGFGLRWRSPLGPIRADIGFKLDRQRFLSGKREKAIAFHIGMGQAF